MSVFAVYNSADSISAHNLLSMQSEDDIFSEIYTGCTARVKVDSAYFTEEYRGPGKLHKPYMEIIGTVSSIFIESEDQRIFPCGAKELQMMEPQRVRIHYVLSTEELADVVNMGLFTDADDFDVPTNLVGNIIEIPVDIKYTGVYETPIGAVEVLDPDERYTCTRENNYFGIFNACPVSKQIEEEKLESYQYYEKTDYTAVEEAVYTCEDTTEPEATDEYNVEAMREREEEEEEQRNISAVAKLIAAQTAEASERRARVNSSDIHAIADKVRANLDARAKANEASREASLSDAMFGVDGQDTRTVLPEKATYEDFKAAAQAVDAEKVKSEKEADDSRENARTVDRAMDNIALNEGIDDIAGYTDGNQYLDSAQSAETESQRQDKEDEKSGKKAMDTVRKADIAADNKALNEGIDDIAGQGAASSSQSTSAAELIASLEENTPSSDGQQFL